MKDDPWPGDIPQRYYQGQIVDGEVTRITRFGIIVDLEAGISGLVHISELSDAPVRIEDLVKLGQKIRMRVLRVDADERKIGLSLKRAQT